VTREELESRAKALLNRRNEKRRDRKRKPDILFAALIIIVCVCMISPLKSCSVAEENFIGVTEAEQVAARTAGIIFDKTEGMHTELTKIDGAACYKVDFSGNGTQYSFIIDAESGIVLKQASEPIADENTDTDNE